MAVIGLVVRDNRDSIITATHALQAWAEKSGHSILPEFETAQTLQLPQGGVKPAQLIAEADPIVTLGGDGTLIGIARYVTDSSPLFVGVNYGRLGFLTEISPDELLPTLESVLNKSAETKSRVMLHATVYRHTTRIFESQAVNDIVIQKGAREKLVDLDVNIDGHPLMRVRADGVIFATPTGSTAYSLAAGGSIIYPSLDVVMLTPICPHSLTYRPIIVPLDAEMTIQIPEYEGRVFISADGQVSTSVEVGDTIHLRRATRKIVFVRSATRSYYEILREKFNWGLGTLDE